MALSDHDVGRPPPGVENENDAQFPRERHKSFIAYLAEIVAMRHRDKFAAAAARDYPGLPLTGFALCVDLSVHPPGYQVRLLEELLQDPEHDSPAVRDLVKGAVERQDIKTVLCITIPISTETETAFLCTQGFW